MRVFVVIKSKSHPGEPNNLNEIMEVFDSRELAEKYVSDLPEIEFEPNVCFNYYVVEHNLFEEFEKERAKEHQADVLSDYETTHGILRE